MAIPVMVKSVRLAAPHFKYHRTTDMRLTHQLNEYCLFWYGRGCPQADPYSVSLFSGKATPLVGQRPYVKALALLDGMDVRAQMRAALE